MSFGVLKLLNHCPVVYDDSILATRINIRNECVAVAEFGFVVVMILVGAVQMYREMVGYCIGTSAHED